MDKILTKSLKNIKHPGKFKGCFFLILHLKNMWSPFLFPIAFLFLLVSCSQQNSHSKTVAKNLNRNWLDSIIKTSDSSYSRPYKRTDFVTAVYYINNKDSTLSQIMKDSAGIIRQIVIAKKNTRTFFGTYYKNGQLQADLPLDEFGQYHGTGLFYFEDGSIQSRGNYEHGLKTGEWKIYNEKGELIATDMFDKNGQVILQHQP